MTETIAWPQAARTPRPRRAFVAMLRRDLYATGRELPGFLTRVVLQPLFLLFVFGRILTGIGYTSHNYVGVLFPGLMGLIAVMTAMQSIAIPLMMDLGWTRELDDRLLAPLPTWLLAVEKILFATSNAVVATALMPPVGLLLIGSIPWNWDRLALLVVIVVLGALVGSGLGLVVGTLVSPARMGLMLTLAFPALLFTGSSQYPWPSLGGVRWFQILTALNPITYVSEGMRAVLVPSVPHLPLPVSLAVLGAAVPVLAWLGIAGFRRRAIA